MPLVQEVAVFSALERGIGCIGQAPGLGCDMIAPLCSRQVSTSQFLCSSFGVIPCIKQVKVVESGSMSLLCESMRSTSS